MKTGYSFDLVEKCTECSHEFTTKESQYITDDDKVLCNRCMRRNCG